MHCFPSVTQKRVRPSPSFVRIFIFSYVGPIMNTLTRTPDKTKKLCLMECTWVRKMTIMYKN